MLTIRGVFAAKTMWGRVGKFILFLLGLVLMPFGVIVWIGLSWHGGMIALEQKIKESAQETGLAYDPELTMKGLSVFALVDKAKEKILFVDKKQKYLVGFDDILSWERNHDWLAFNVRDEKTPILRVGKLSPQDAMNWFARLDLILNRR